jgi:hypothetical protein
MRVQAEKGGTPARDIVTARRSRGGTDVSRPSYQRQGRLKVAAIILFVVTVTQTVLAQDWPQWRGPNRDGVIVSFTAPKA